MFYSSYLIMEFVTKLMEAVEDCVTEALSGADAQLDQYRCFSQVNDDIFDIYIRNSMILMTNPKISLVNSHYIGFLN